MIGLVASLAGFARGEAPPEQLNLDEIPAILYDEVVIPVPHEIFASLDKLGARDWNGQLRRGAVKIPTGRADQALLFGLVIANGFVAVEAEDSEAVKNAGRDVLKLAKALGVQKPVVLHAQSIIDGARTGEWSSVRRELELTQQTVKETMEGMRDQDLAELVSVGGWLGGTHALAGILEQEFDAEGAELLHQPELLGQLSTRYFKIPQKLRGGPVPKSTGETLKALKPLMNANGEDGITLATVRKIHQITRSLVRAIHGEKK